MRWGFREFQGVFLDFLEHTFVVSRYNVYVESSLDHSLELAESAALAAVSSLQNGAVVTAANVAAARALAWIHRGGLGLKGGASAKSAR